MGFKSILVCTAALWPMAGLAAAPVTLGSGNVAVIDPPVPHPKEAPCVVPLYHGAKFGANNANFVYTPPAGCPGPYAVIVLSVDVSLNAGIQYDRTGTIWIGGAPLWFGTTSEPSPQQGPSWHFERDVTDYTSLLATTQNGFALIANYTNAQDTSIITSSAKLLFYPATGKSPAPRVPDIVIPLAAAGGGTVGLGSSSDALTITPTLPTNIQAASMDVYLQGQSGDEFWYTCVPDSLSSELESCGGGTVREGEISIDGTPAGVAPVSPWIFTGGIDPYLWTPIPGVQTLDFKPFRVELSPFAGVLSNGAPHSISLSVFGANNYFSVAGALFLYLDPASTTVTGTVTENTLTAVPVVKTSNTIVSTDTQISGGVDTSEARNFTIAGNVTGTGGTINYQVQQTTRFSNHQTFLITGSQYLQDIKQNTVTSVQATASGPDGTTVRTVNHTTPLTVDINEVVGGNGNGKQKTGITQLFSDTNLLVTNGAVTQKDLVSNTITTGDTLLFNSAFQITGNKNQASSASYIGTSLHEPCYGLKLASIAGVLVSAVKGCD
jgi:hypothetical protein